MRKDGKDNLKSRFSEYLQQKGKDPKSLDSTVERFSSTIFDIFFEGQEYLEVYGEDAKNHYDRIFNKYVLPKMKNIISNKNKQNRDRPIYFKPITYNKYKGLFISFVEFIKENGGYTNGINLTERKEHLENSLQGLYGNFNKKELIRAWHDYIQKDTGKNGDKLRGCLADIYGSSDNEGLEKLYEIFFSSYEICSKITSENKGKQNFEKKDAFKEAFSKLEEEIPKYYLGKLGEIRSLFGKYLNFIPKYRDKIFGAIDGDTEGGKVVQKVTEQDLIDNLSEEERAIIEEETFKNNEDPFDYDEDRIVYENIGGRDSEGANIGTEGDGLGPVTVIRRSRNENRGIYDQTERGDIIAPINYGIFPDPEPISEGDVEDAQNGGAESNNGIDKKSEKTAQGIIIHFDDEEKEEKGENPDYTGDYTDSYKNR